MADEEKKEEGKKIIIDEDWKAEAHREKEVLAAQEEEKKIIIDEDWKTEAHREKEVLAAQEEVEKKEAESQKREGPLPLGNFAALVSMLVTQALFALGLVAVEGEDDQKREPDLALAKYNIDMLETLEEKTKGNLSEEEQKILKDMLGQVRMAYVKITG